MSKKWYEYFVEIERKDESPDLSDPPWKGVPSGNPPPPAASNDAAKAIADIAASLQPPPAAAKFEKPMAAAAATGSSLSFPEIYSAAGIPSSAHGYSILKLSEMLNSPHIRNLPADVKKGSIMVALEAAGVKIEEVIQDAIRRDQALDAFERVREKSVQDLEARKIEENNKIQADIDKYVAEQKARIQSNQEEVLKQKQSFDSWRQEKLIEEQKIADCVSHFVTPNPISTAANPRPALGDKKTGL